MSLLIGISCGLWAGDGDVRGGFEFDRCSRHYSLGVQNAGALPILLPALDLGANAALLAARLDGLLLSGGPDLDSASYACPLDPSSVVQTARDQSELALFAAFWRAHKPIFAICRGLQLVTVALGGSLTQDTSLLPQAQAHRAPDGQSPLFHPLVFTPGSLLARLAGGTTAQVNSYHHQHVAELAAGLTVTARSTDGLIEGLEWVGDGRWLLGVQWHPERMRDTPFARALFTAFVAACGRVAPPLPEPR